MNGRDGENSLMKIWLPRLKGKVWYTEERERDRGGEMGKMKRKFNGEKSFGFR